MAGQLVFNDTPNVFTAPNTFAGVSLTGLLNESATDNITAHAGGGQANAVQLTAELNRVTTVVTSGDSVKLPQSSPGLTIIVVNHGANACQVYGFGTDQIDDIATATGVSQMPSSTVLYTCHTAGNWYTEGLASGFSKQLGLQTFSYATIAANSAGTQAGGTPVTSMLNNITSAGASYSVTLPPSVAGVEMTVHNTSTQTILVFPNAGGTGTEAINSGAANASYSMATNTSTVFTCTTVGQWYTVPRVAS